MFLRRTELDAKLAKGLDPAGDPALALRAQQLTSSTTRRAIAATLGNLLDAAEEPPQAFGSQGSRPPLQRASLLAAEGELRALAERLRQPEKSPPHAVAFAALLVWDSASPIYNSDADETVAGSARTALDALAIQQARRS